MASLPFVCVYLFFIPTFCFATLVDSFKLDDLKTCFLNIDRRIEVLTIFSFSIDTKILISGQIMPLSLSATH